MKHCSIYYLAIAFISLYSAASYSVDFVYQCTYENGEISLQDKACKPNAKEETIKLMKFSQESSDGLRPLELTLLERNFELEKMQKEHQYILKEQNSLAQIKADAKRKLFDHKLKSFLFYGSRMDYPWSNGYPFGKVGNYGGAIAGYGAPGTILSGDTNTASINSNPTNGSTSLGVVNSGSGTIGAGVGGAGGAMGAGGPGFIINITP